MWQKVAFSFPVQLILLHLRKNLLMVALWALLVAIVLGGFGKVLGIPYLFLDPEYLNQVSWLGFFVMGVGLAIFTMAFHMTTYIMEGSRFKFLAILQRPFLHYCLNNGFFPMIFYTIYIIAFIVFQSQNELDSNWEIFKFVLGFVGGSFITYLLLFLYFQSTNKDFFLLFADTVDKRLKKTKIPRANVMNRYKEGQKHEGEVGWYLGTDFRLKMTRPDLARFDRGKLLRVFDQNHLNLFIIQTALIIGMIGIGLFKEVSWFQFPAAVSAVLLMAIITMLLGAVSFWLRGWTTTFLIASLILFNYFSKTSFFNRPHAAYGLDYDTAPAPYNLERIYQLLHPDTIEKDMGNTLEILNHWKERQQEEKPKMVILSTSGGGQRAALWTLRAMQGMQKATQGRFFERCQLITGASGGMIGAAFFRELYLQSLEDPNLDPMDEKFLHQIASDNLNPIIFTLLVNDLFIRSQYFEYGGRKYLKDRGGAFENQLNRNIKGVLDKPLLEYWQPEFEGKIPLMPITPLVINDARKLFISPHSMSYMGISLSRAGGVTEKSQAIDFIRFFGHQDAQNLRFLSALRMGASFPFITPNISLPSAPPMETMDTGLADNFGIQDAFRFMHVFKEWIAANTSGVVLVAIRDSEKITEIEHKAPPTLFQKMMIPLQNIYRNWDHVQTLNNETLFHYMHENLPFALHRVEFEYTTKEMVGRRALLVEATEGGLQQELEKERASLNWRLTAREKKAILENFDSRQNQMALSEFVELLYP
ncbi:patatin-like phospholipase family protein [Pleomorphovibrio marinus]|uniref:patatin-like phospholipase family protein n=1 Tax=Pleomorphovibrio marinus TaxID=2164132 RepID=UPI000E0CBF16|nr:patatin-like phospholipase family protein [Pleomorphovibrio marinus]